MNNGMMMPATFQLSGMNASTATEAGNKAKEANAGKFGSILAMLSSSNGIQEQSAMSESNGLLNGLAEILDLTSVEEVLTFLQENGFSEEMLPEVIDGHFVIQNEVAGEEFLNAIRDLMPTFTKRGSIAESGSHMMPIQAFFATLEEAAEDLLMKIEQGKLQEHFTNEDLVLLVAVMHMTAIEGPQTDLTLKQEHQLHALQEALKTLGHQLSREVVREKKLPFFPFQVQHNQTGSSESIKLPLENEQPKSMNPSIIQTSYSHLTNVSLENINLESEVQGNHRAEMLLKELQNIFKRANFGQTGGTNRISIKLYPEHLGQLRIELLQTNGLLTARILASNALGKEMLESQLHQLRQAFLQQNIQVERIDISQMLTETPTHEKNHAFNEQFKQQQEQAHEETNEEDGEDSLTFSEYLIELEG